MDRSYEKDAPNFSGTSNLETQSVKISQDPHSGYPTYQKRDFVDILVLTSGSIPQICVWGLHVGGPPTLPISMTKTCMQAWKSKADKKTWKEKKDQTGNHLGGTPWKINGWNLNITQLKRKIIFQNLDSKWPRPA